MKYSAFGLSFLLVTGMAFAQATPVAYVGARILTVEGDPIPDGVLVIEKGKIVAVGSREATTVAEGTTVIEVKGVIIPGLVDTHSHIGGPSGGDSTGPINPDCRVLDAIDVRDPGLRKAQAGGLTTVNVMPGSGHLLSGQTIYVKLRDGNTIEDIAIRNRAGTIMGGMKMANGTNSQKGGAFPGTRARSASLMRSKLIAAREYKQKIDRADGDKEKLPARDLGLEALVEVLDRTRMVHHHTHRHDDILTVLRLQKEFGFRVVLHHVSEGWKVAKEIAAAGIACSVILIDSPGGKLEAIDLGASTCAILAKAGVDISIHTDDGITDSRLFLRTGAMAIRGGLSAEHALEALTIGGARQLDLAHRVGSLKVGKDADFVLLSGDPFATRTKIMGTWVEGKQVFDRELPEDLLLATGGWGASNGQVLHICCDGHDEEHGQ